MMTANEFKNTVISMSERIFPMVARMLGNTTNAEDAIQEIMIKLWERREQLEHHPNIPGFVFLTARNYCKDLLKKKGLELDSSNYQLQILESKMRPDEMEWNELTAFVDNLLKKIPKQQREIMIMRDIDGLEFVEIAAVTQLKVEHVRVLLSRARKHVGIHLKNIYSYE